MIGLGYCDRLKGRVGNGRRCDINAHVYLGVDIVHAIVYLGRCIGRYLAGMHARSMLGDRCMCV